VYIDKLNKYQVINKNRYIKHFLSLLYRIFGKTDCHDITVLVPVPTNPLYRLSLCIQLYIGLCPNWARSA